MLTRLCCKRLRHLVPLEVQPTARDEYEWSLKKAADVLKLLIEKRLHNVMFHNCVGDGDPSTRPASFSESDDATKDAI